jgi:hypothetical protein
MPRGVMPRGMLMRGAGARAPDPRMMASTAAAPEAGPTGAPPMPRYNARAMRPGGMAKGGKVKGMTRGDGAATRGHTRGKMV